MQILCHLHIGLNDLTSAGHPITHLPCLSRDDCLKIAMLTVDSLLGPSHLLSENRTDYMPDPNLPQIPDTVIENTI